MIGQYSPAYRDANQNPQSKSRVQVVQRAQRALKRLGVGCLSMENPRDIISVSGGVTLEGQPALLTH